MASATQHIRALSVLWTDQPTWLAFARRANVWSPGPGPGRTAVPHLPHRLTDARWNPRVGSHTLTKIAGDERFDEQLRVDRPVWTLTA
jgi:hypothetical protein